MRQANVRGIQEDEPGSLAIRLPFVQWQAYRLVAEIHLYGALFGQVVPRQQTTELSQSSYIGRCRLHFGPDNTGYEGNNRCHEQYSDECDQSTLVDAFQSERSMLHIVSLLLLVVLALVPKQKH